MRDLPDWLPLVVLPLAAWRTFHLLAFDDILDRPRRYVTRLGTRWSKDGDPVPANYRDRLHDFIECPYCLGFWVAFFWVGFLAIWEEGAVWAALPFSFSTVVIGLNKLLSD